MPTNIYDVGMPVNTGAGWADAGQGLMGISSVLAAAYAARDAEQAANKAKGEEVLKTPGLVKAAPKATEAGSAAGMINALPATSIAGLLGGTPPSPSGAGSGNLGGNSSNPFLATPPASPLTAPQIDFGALGNRRWNPFGNPTNAFAAQEFGNQIPGIRRNPLAATYGGL